MYGNHFVVTPLKAHRNRTTYFHVFFWVDKKVWQELLTPTTFILWLAVVSFHFQSGKKSLLSIVCSCIACWSGPGWD